MKIYEIKDLEKMIAESDVSYRHELDEIKSFIEDESYLDDALENTLFELNKVIGKTSSKKKLTKYALNMYMRDVCDSALSECDAISEDVCRSRCLIERIQGCYSDETL